MGIGLTGDRFPVVGCEADKILWRGVVGVSRLMFPFAEVVGVAELVEL